MTNKPISNPPLTEDSGVVRKSANVSSKRPALTFDAARYEAMINDLKLDEDARHELLGVMWNIIVGFVDLGFEVKLADETQESCGQDSGDADAASHAMLDCFNQHSEPETGLIVHCAIEVDSKEEERA